MTWRRVSKESTCPICGKPDWCLVTAEGNAAICARIQSDRTMKSGVGWLHIISGEASKWRTIVRVEPKRASAELDAIAKQCCSKLTKERIAWLSFQLGVSIESLRSLRVGWSINKHAYSFPMRDESGRVVGIRYRCELSGKKFSEAGGREGMFYQPQELLSDYLVIVEGASDCAALMTINFASTIGRANNVGNVEQLLSICRGYRFRRVVLIPDNDEPGKRGSTELSAAFVANSQQEPSILQLPDSFKDCRACIQKRKNARWLQSTLARLTQFNPKEHHLLGANEHE